MPGSLPPCHMHGLTSILTFNVADFQRAIPASRSSTLPRPNPANFLSSAACWVGHKPAASPILLSSRH